MGSIPSKSISNKKEPYGFFFIGAGDGNRTRVSGLGSERSAIELRLHSRCRRHRREIRKADFIIECLDIANLKIGYLRKFAPRIWYYVRLAEVQKRLTATSIL